MAAQPLNASITVARNVRAYRQDLRHESVEAITKRLRPLVMSVPGEEILSGVQTRDTTLADFSAYMGPASPVSGRGMPVVVGVNAPVTYAHAQATLPGVDFGFKIGTDRFLTNDSTSLDNDLHADLRAL